MKPFKIALENCSSPFSLSYRYVTAHHQSYESKSLVVELKFLLQDNIIYLLSVQELYMSYFI